MERGRPRGLLAGAGVLARDAGGNTALHRAVQGQGKAGPQGHELAEVLLEGATDAGLGAEGLLSAVNKEKQRCGPKPNPKPKRPWLL